MRLVVVRTSFRGAPRRIILNASSTASLGSVCARDGDVGSACRLDDASAFCHKPAACQIVPGSFSRVTPEGSTRIIAAIHKATNFRLDCDSIRLQLVRVPWPLNWVVNRCLCSSAGYLRL